MKNLIKFFTVSLILIAAASTQAQDIAKVSPIKFLGGIGLELGGDSVAEILFTNGEDQKVNAGQGISVEAGLQFKIPTTQFALRGTVGYKYVTTAADNANITLTRIPINLSANYFITDDIRIGAGLSLHNSIKFKADGIGPDNNFDSTSGPRIEVAWKGIGLSYTSMNYTDTAGEEYKASAFGITWTFVLPK